MQLDCSYGLHPTENGVAVVAVVCAGVCGRWRWSDWLWDGEWSGLDKAAWLGLQILCVSLVAVLVQPGL
jgi:hypothetical protein